MNYLNGEYYVEVEDHRYKVQPTEIIILRKRDTPQYLRTQYQVQNNTQIRRNQKVVENNGKIELDIRNILKMKNNHLFINQSVLPVGKKEG